MFATGKHLKGEHGLRIRKTERFFDFSQQFLYKQLLKYEQNKKKKKGKCNHKGCEFNSLRVVENTCIYVLKTSKLRT